MSAPDLKLSPLDRLLTVTFFVSYAAAEKREEMVSLRALTLRVRTTTAAVKTKLPWVKLGAFGALRNHKDGVSIDRQSLRHDRNVLSICGVEGDYDSGLLTVKQACAVLRGAGLAGMIYTSPSHTEDAPRWRVLCPLSVDVQPDERARHMARLNGVFQGALAVESFTLSQSYYYGSVKNNPGHRVELVDGDYLDLRGDLDTAAIGRPRLEYTPTAAPSKRTESTSKFMEAVIVNALGKVRGAADGQKHHALRSQSLLLGGYQHAGGYSTSEVLGWLMDAVPASAKDRKAAAITALWGLERGAEKPIDIPDRPRRPEPSPPPTHPDDPGYDPDNIVDIQGKDWVPPDPTRQSTAHDKPRGSQYGRLNVMGMAELDTAAPRDYLLKGVISPAEISLWVGAPKCGKSFLLLWATYLLSLGISIFGRRVKPTKVLYVAAEGEAGIARRIRALRDKYGPSENFHFIAQPIDLLRDNGHKLEVIDAATALGSQLIAVDTLNRALAGGDENAPQDMGIFIRNVSEIKHQTNAHIAIVHHGTKSSDGRSPRGHGSLEGADDALIEVVKLPDGSRTATLVHSKDDADGMCWNFVLDTVEMGEDEDGDQITTLIVRENVEAPSPRTEKQAPLSNNEQIALTIFDKAIKAEGVLATVGENHEERPVLPIAIWRRWFYAEAKPGESGDIKRTYFNRALDGLQAKKRISTMNEYIWRTEVW